MSNEAAASPMVPADAHRGIAFHIGSLTFRLEEPRLFLSKAASVLLLSYALLPVLAFKSDIPALLYVGLLVAIHMFVLGIYLYRVRFRELDPNLRSLFARVVALIVVTYLLVIVSQFEDGSSWLTLSYQMAGITVFHAVLLALIMFHVEHRVQAA